MKKNDPELTSENASTSVPNSGPAAIALKWARWPAAFGLVVGISAAMKGSAPILGKVLLGTLVGGLLAAILGGITFAVVFLVVKLK